MTDTPIATDLDPKDWKLAMLLIDVQTGRIGILTAVRRVKDLVGCA